MVHAVYLLLSSIQILGIFYLAYSLFRFKLRTYLGETLFISLILGGVIHLIRVVFHYGSITPLVICLLMILFMWLFIKIPIFYSALMVVTSYVCLFVIETTLIFTVGSLVPDLIQSPFSLGSLMLIIATDLILFLLSWWLYRKGMGFSFSFKTNKFKSDAIGLLFAILLSVIVDGTIYYSTIQFEVGFTIAILIGVISLGILLYLSFRKESSEHSD